MMFEKWTKLAVVWGLCLAFGCGTQGEAPKAQGAALQAQGDERPSPAKDPEPGDDLRLYSQAP